MFHIEVLYQELELAKRSFLNDELTYNSLLEQVKHDSNNYYLIYLLNFAFNCYNSSKKLLDEIEKELNQCLEDEDNYE